MFTHLLGCLGAAAEDLDVVATSDGDRDSLRKVQFIGGASTDNARAFRAVQNGWHDPQFDSAVTEKFGIPPALI
jgi:hypothetical protein